MVAVHHGSVEWSEIEGYWPEWTIYVQWPDGFRRKVEQVNAETKEIGYYDYHRMKWVFYPISECANLIKMKPRK